jgi:hypothetical protein
MVGGAGVCSGAATSGACGAVTHTGTGVLLTCGLWVSRKAVSPRAAARRSDVDVGGGVAGELSLDDPGGDRFPCEWISWTTVSLHRLLEIDTRARTSPSVRARCRPCKPTAAFHRSVCAWLRSSLATRKAHFAIDGGSTGQLGLMDNKCTESHKRFGDGRIRDCPHG